MGAGTVLPSRRARVWGTLLVALGLSIGLLLWANASRGTRAVHPAAGPVALSSARRPIVVTVVDEAGAVVPGAEAFVRSEPGAADAPGTTWSPEDGRLELPWSGAPRSVVVQAPGFRMLRADDVRGDRRLVLRPGYVVRLHVTGDADRPAPPLHVVLQVRAAPSPPEGTDGGARAPTEADRLAAVVRLMEPVAPPTEGIPPLPREGFGMALDERRAGAGVRVPVAGRYVVRWGLLDQRRGRWYSLPDGASTEIDVADQDAPQDFDVPVTSEAIAATKKGLDATFELGR